MGSWGFYNWPTEPTDAEWWALERREAEWEARPTYEELMDMEDSGYLEGEIV